MNVTSIKIVADFDTAATAVAQVAKLRPQVVLLSASVPDVPGLQACLQILDAAIDTRVVILSARLRDEEIVAAMMAGAAGYLPKDAARSEFIRTVRASGRGAMYVIAPATDVVLRLWQNSRKAVDLNLLNRARRLGRDGRRSG